MADISFSSLSVGDKNSAVPGAALLSSGEAALDSRSASLPLSGVGLHGSPLPAPPSCPVCSLDPLWVGDYWFATPLGWQWGGWEGIPTLQILRDTFPEKDRVLCPEGFDPRRHFPREGFRK